MSNKLIRLWFCCKCEKRITKNTDFEYDYSTSKFTCWDCLEKTDPTKENIQEENK